MARYFVAGNFWAAFLVFLVLGQQRTGSGPVHYSFFGHGFMSPTLYSFLQLACFMAAIACFRLAWATRPNRSQAKEAEQSKLW